MAFEKFITLSLADFTTLSTTGTVTIDGTTLTYQPDKVIYLVPEPEAQTITIDTTTGSESISDGTNTLNVVTRDTAQTISGEKTIANAVSLKFAGTYTGQIVNQENQLRFKYGGSDKLKISSANITSSAHLIPNSGNTYNLGTSTYKWNNLYLAGIIGDGNNSTYGLKLPNTSGFTANKTIATTDQITPQWYGTQTEYDNLGTYDSNTIYNILES